MLCFPLIYSKPLTQVFWVDLTLYRNFLQRMMPIFNAVLPEALNITTIQNWFSDF